MTAAEEALVIAASKIHGIGMFAAQAYAEGEEIASIRNFEVFSSPRLGSVQIAADAHVIDETVLRWVNHSCLPNAAIMVFGSEILIEALRSIRPGEEITCDYEVTEDVIPVPFQCRCGCCTGRRIAGASVRS